MWKMPDFQPGNRPSASKLQQLSNSIELLSNSLSANGSTSSCGILSAETLPESFWVRVLGNDGGSPPAHYWQQVLDADEDGNGPVDKEDGLIGDPDSMPLYEVNGGSLADNTIVRVWRGLGDWYYTEAGDGSKYLKIRQHNRFSVDLGRIISDVSLINGEAVITSSNANFASTDVGKKVVSAANLIPSGSIIVSVQDSETCTISSAATGNSTIDSLRVIAGSMWCYEADGMIPTGAGDGWDSEADANGWDQETINNNTIYLTGNAGNYPSPDQIYRCYKINESIDGKPVYYCDHSPSIFARVTASNMLTVCVGGRRTGQGNITANSNTITCDAPTFTQADVGKSLYYETAPDGAYITTVVDSYTAELSVAPTLSSPVTFNINFTSKFKAWPATRVVLANSTELDNPTLQGTDTVYLVNLESINALNTKPLIYGTVYQCSYLGYTADGISIWLTRQKEIAVASICITSKETVYQSNGVAGVASGAALWEASFTITDSSGGIAAGSALAYCFQGLPTNSYYTGILCGYEDNDPGKRPIYMIPSTPPIFSSGSDVVTHSSGNLYLDGSSVIFGTPSNNPAAPADYIAPGIKYKSSGFTGLIIQYGANYQGATGTDGIGNMFISGLCVNVGGSPPSDDIDGGSYW